MKATIIYPQEATFQIELPPDCQMFVPSALNYCWRATNPDSGNDALTRLNKQRARLRSSMVGDIYIVSDRYFMVDGSGFIEISQAQSLLIQRIKSSDRLMGYDWLRKHFKVGIPIQSRIF